MTLGSKTINLLVAITAIAFLTVEIGLLLQGQTGPPVSIGPDDSRSEVDAKVLTYAFRTNVSGIISVDITWTEANSPYVVTGSVLVSEGATLTIEPGVIVKLESAKGIQIDGMLVVRGTEVKPIVLTSIRDDSFGGDTNGDGDLTLPAQGDWNELLLTNLSVDAVCDSNGNYLGGSVIENAKILYGGGKADSGIQAALHTVYSSHLIKNTAIMFSRSDGVYVNYGSARITGCTIGNNSQNGVSADVAWGLSVSPFFELRDNNITANGAFGVGFSLGGAANGVISYNSITRNGARGLSVYSATWGTSFEISHNSIVANNGVGICVSYGTYQISHNYISSNFGGGIDASECDSVISDNLIVFNRANYDTQGVGIRVWVYMTSLRSLTIMNNVLAENIGSSGSILSLDMGSSYSYGMNAMTVHDNSIVRNIVDHGTVVRLNERSNSDITFANNLVTQNYNLTSPCNSVEATGLPAIVYNNLFGNGCAIELYDANAAGGDYVDATNNWWGTANESQVQEKIYDWTDDSARGMVDFSPFSSSTRTDTPVSPPRGVVVSTEGGVATLTWSPNPEDDVAGYRIYYDADSGYPYEHSIDVGDTTTHALTEVSAEDGLFVAVTAYDFEADGSNDICEGHESWYSNQTIIDIVPPTGSVLINNGDEWVGGTNYLWLIFDAKDNTSGVADMRLSEDGQNWTPWQAYTSSTYYSLASSMSEGVKTIHVQYRDRVGLVSPSYNDSITMDYSQPTGDIRINGGANYTTSVSVTLTLSASDTASGVAGMHFSNDGMTWTDWEGYSTAKSWDLTAGDGVKQVSVEFKDGSGKVSASSSDTIVLDATFESINPVANAGSDLQAIAGADVYFDGTNSTDNVGIVSYEWNFGDGSNGSGRTTMHQYQSPGTYVVVLTVRDSHNNTATDTISVTVTSPEQSPTQPQNDDSGNLPIWMIAAVAGAAVAVALTSLFLLRRRHA